ncbi:HAMP domain-containing protein [Aerococcaceae bacterium WS4759]|uniref:histidine kinase n=1 Tax=Fundicoccus ignavus TaxID=2664442 RepID=A0A6I2GIC6_9LACT|nr:HAMP domain-containing sensor histidine kinase [Fundicoccus ignavus]MRI85592.1 HAMP domain-containing protein [Fundicoccus ignavus]
MKFLWQQILGFLLVIITALAISAYRISDYMTTEIFKEREAQLLQYGNNIVSNNFTRPDLVRASQLLESENIVIQVYLDDGRIIYPTYDQRFSSNLSDTDLNRIAEGASLGLQYAQRFVDPETQLQMTTVYIPLQQNEVAGFPAGFISLGAPLESLEEQIAQSQNHILISFIIATIVGIIMSVFYAIFQTRKIKKLQQATREIASGNYEVIVDTGSADEFGDLARDFDVMSESLRNSQEEIKRQENLRRQFMMDAAHEMRTPLTTMSGLLEGLQYDMIPEAQRGRSLELISKETKRLTRLVNENLDYEKIRSRQITLKKQVLNGVSLLTQIKEQLNVKAEQKNNQIIVQAHPDLEIWADYDRIVQILINLVTNAIQFSQDSEIVLVGTMTETQTILKVIDEGIGIDTKQIESIWERFYKVDVSRKNTQFGESGIGLAVVHSLVEAHEGTIEVESELGHGSTFIIKLPRKLTEDSDDMAT